MSSSFYFQDFSFFCCACFHFYSEFLPGFCFGLFYYNFHCFSLCFIFLIVIFISIVSKIFFLMYSLSYCVIPPRCLLFSSHIFVCSSYFFCCYYYYYYYIFKDLPEFIYIPAFYYTTECIYSFCYYLFIILLYFFRL